jgi:hypothetical protein
MVAVMGGTAVRMVAVFGGGLILYYLDRYFSHASFWICVVVFYLFTLTLEMVILVGRHASPRQMPKP